MEIEAINSFLPPDLLEFVKLEFDSIITIANLENSMNSVDANVEMGKLAIN